ncbi:CLUMA_CG020232, isoform A [Clunio marinus]|uniref:CLUMA_CG020232, isoform A n=1 Tax=Clunio marinus TaxID=568069 RepID=A0A1J1J660_9DIPT|nr:CLUMA_CG020232, isoform A [Clunio marinus]
MLQLLPKHEEKQDHEKRDDKGKLIYKYHKVGNITELNITKFDRQEIAQDIQAMNYVVST